MPVRRTHVSGAFNAPTPCHWGTDTRTAVGTRGRWHGERTLIEGTAKARRQYVERAFAVGFSACDSVRRRHGGRKRRALWVRWLQNHFQTPISRRRRRTWDVTPPQHQTRKSRSTYGRLWPRHYQAAATRLKIGFTSLKYPGVSLYWS